MNKYIYMMLFLLSFSKSIAQKPYISPFADSISVSHLYNPFKIDSINSDQALLKISWYDEVVALEKRGNFEKAYKIFNTKDKDPLGMYLIGKYNYLGLGIKKNQETAFSWFQKSSGLNFSYGLESLSSMYFLGETKKSNDSIALILLKKAFNGGMKSVSTKIAYIYQNGNIVKKNLDSAAIWYRKSIGLNDKYAYYNMAVIDESKKDIENAIAGYKKAAEANIDIGSQRLGEIYYEGIGLKQDYDKAKIWFMKGCEQNNASSCNFLGIIYLKQKDSTLAFQNFKKGNLLRDTQSTYNLALCLSEGIGSPKDEKQAFVFYNEVVKLSQALNNIGTLYERKMIGKNDYLEAKNWYEKGAVKNNVFAMLNAGKILEMGGFNLSIDTAKAKFWFEKAANLGNEDGMYYLARLLRNSNIIKAIEWAEKLAKVDNRGMRLAGDLNRQRADLIVISEDKKNTTENRIKESSKIILYNKALKWYESAGKKGDDSSMVRLGQLYYIGKLVKKDHKRAQFWWRKAADKGNATANYNLAYLYEKGFDNIEANINYKSAAEYYKEAVETKNIKADLKRDAAFKLGNLYQYTDFKKGLEKNSNEALKWYKIAAELKDSDAMYEIGLIYEKGSVNIKNNKEEAIKWYKESIVLGNNDAKSALERLGEKNISN